MAMDLNVCVYMSVWNYWNRIYAEAQHIRAMLYLNFTSSHIYIIMTDNKTSNPEA